MTGNQGPTLLAYLKPRAETRRGWVETTVPEIVAVTGIDHHDVVKVLHQWQRQGLVKFTTHVNGKQERLTAIRLTVAGMGFEYSDERVNGQVAVVDDIAVVDDYADTVAVAVVATTGESSQAKGGKRTWEKLLDQWRTQAHDIEGLSEPEASARVVQLQHDHYAAITQKGAAKRAATIAAKVAEAPSIDRGLLDELPLIASLGQRQERLLNAAVSIEADAPDIAETLIARAQNTYTLLEREVLTLLERLGQR